MDVEVTKFVVNESQYTEIGAIQSQVPLFSSIRENKFTKKIGIFTPVPFSSSVFRLSRLQHIAYAPIIGCTLQADGKPFQLVENGTNCSLSKFLRERKNNNDTANDPRISLQNIAFGICSGMRYAEMKGFMHGNLSKDSIFIDEHEWPLIHGVGFANLWKSSNTRSDINGYMQILQDLFGDTLSKCPIEQRIVNDIKNGHIKTFQQIYQIYNDNIEELKAKSMYFKMIDTFDRARELSLCDNSEAVQYAHCLCQIQSPIAGTMGNNILLQNGEFPHHIPALNAIEIPEIQLSSLKTDDSEYPVFKELNVPYGTATIKNGSECGAVLVIPIPFNRYARKIVNLHHPVLSLPTGVVLATDNNPFKLVLEYGITLNKVNYNNALIGVASALAYCHRVGIHHGCLSEQFITLENGNYPKLSYVGIAEAYGAKITDKDDVQQFGRLAKRIAVNPDEKMTNLIDKCIEGTITMEEVSQKLLQWHSTESYARTLIGFEYCMQKALSGDYEACDGILVDYKLMTISKLPLQLVQQLRNAIMHQSPENALYTQNSITKENANDRLLNGLTPLHLAALKNDVALAKKLIREGADPNATSDDGQTPLHMAARSGNYAIYDFLRKFTKRGIKDSYGKLPREAVSPSIQWHVQDLSTKPISSVIHSIFNLVF